MQHGDVDSLSIYANGLKQQGGNVMHGDIKELSLVVAGANPGAFIDFVDLAHGEGAEQEVIFCANEPITLAHADEGKADDSADDGKKSADGDKKDTGDGDTVEAVINSLTESRRQLWLLCSPMLWPTAILTTMMAKRRRTTATSNILTNPKEETRL